MLQPACGWLSAAACRPVTLTQPQTVVQMTFEASKSVTLWFKQWHTHTWGGYAATCLVLVVICLIHEALTCYRARFHKLYLAEPEYQPLEPGSARGLETGSARGERATPRLGPASHDPAAKERWGSMLTLCTAQQPLWQHRACSHPSACCTRLLVQYCMPSRVAVLMSATKVPKDSAACSTSGTVRNRVQLAS